MLKYKEYIMNENVGESSNYNEGEKVVYIADLQKPYNKKHDGKKGVIVHDFKDGEYNIRFEDGNSIIAFGKELSSLDKEKTSQKIDDIEIGSNVKVISADTVKYRDHISNTENIKQLANYTKDKINGKIGKVTKILDKKTNLNLGKYLVDIEGNTYALYGNEITTDLQYDTNKYVENQFGSSISKIDLGQRVIVSGYKGRSQIEGRKGFVRRITPNEYLINFDTDESKNQSSFSMMVDKKYVKSIEDGKTPSIVYKVGDKVICIDEKEGNFYNKVGEVTRVWEDEFMVFFEDFNTSVTLKPKQIKIKEYAKTKSTGFTNVQNEPNVKPITGSNSTDKNIEEEDEDEEGVIITKTKEKFKKADLLTHSYKDFFGDDEKIVTNEEVVTNRLKFQGLIDNPDVNEFKKVFYERSVKVSEIIEQYFTFLKAKVAGDLSVFRTLEEIKNEDLLTTKTKVRASESRDISKKYSFDQGIIAYWKFNDAVIFKTI
jgi:hypothetical protein